MLSEKLLVIKSRIAKIELLNQKVEFSVKLNSYGRPMDEQTRFKMADFIANTRLELREEIALLKSAVSEL